jgi:hypothetical protein
MSVERCYGSMAAMVLTAVLFPLARAASPPAPPPAPEPVPLPLLEFLGGHAPTSRAHKSDNNRWLEYLSRVNLGKTAARAAQAPAPARRKPVCGSAHAPQERGR